MDEKRFRFDLAVAGFALVISAIAAAASAYQTYVINQQFSATVWPYLSFNNTYDRTAGSFELDLRNVGLGPAIVKTSEVLYDGKPIVVASGTDNPLDVALKPMFVAAREEMKQSKRHGTLHTSTSSLNPGDVVPAGTSITMLRADGPAIVRRVLASQNKLALNVCYCSILGRCWMLRLQDRYSQPSDVRVCPLPQ